MRKHQIEAWALSVIERVEKGQPIEDSRVELKAAWIEPGKAARRIAGHANAAGGEPILWLVGVDEAAGTVPGVNFADLSSWYNAVRAAFDELAPEPISINVPANGVTVAALYFETDRAPYVVKNLAGGAIHREVPWREATCIKSATRSQLLRLLSPLQRLPDVEVFNASLTAVQTQDVDENRQLAWTFTMYLYAAPRGDTRVVIPSHRCRAWFEIEGFVPKTPLGSLQFRNSNPQSLAKGTGTEVILDGPREVGLMGNVKTRLHGPQFAGTLAQVSVDLCPLEAGRSVPLSVRLKHRRDGEHRPGWHSGCLKARTSPNACDRPPRLHSPHHPPPVTGRPSSAPPVNETPNAPVSPFSGARPLRG